MENQLEGYNNPWFFGNWPKNGYYPSDQVVVQIKVLDPDVLRFPGGNIGNDYDVNKPGYGAPKEVATNYIHNHMRLGGAIGGKTTFVANLFQPLLKPDSEAYWIKNIVDAVRICKPEFVELGNELQIYPELTGVWTGDPKFYEDKKKFAATVVANAYRYVALCDKVMKEIRTTGINPKFGVCMDMPLHTRGRNWNQVIRNWLRYDAEIFHPYMVAKSIVEVQNQINKYVEGSKRPLWFTEYGWIHGWSQSNILNSQDLGKEYYKAFPLNFIQACRDDQRVEMICRHQLYGTNIYSVINPEK